MGTSRRDDVGGKAILRPPDFDVKIRGGKRHSRLG